MSGHRGLTWWRGRHRQAPREWFGARGRSGDTPLSHGSAEFSSAGPLQSQTGYLLQCVAVTLPLLACWQTYNSRWLANRLFAKLTRSTLVGSPERQPPIDGRFATLLCQGSQYTNRKRKYGSVTFRINACRGILQTVPHFFLSCMASLIIVT